jgi:hypothetical protein
VKLTVRCLYLMHIKFIGAIFFPKSPHSELSCSSVSAGEPSATTQLRNPRGVASTLHLHKQTRSAMTVVFTVCGQGEA